MMASLSSLVADRATANKALDGTARKLAMCVKALDGRLSMLCSTLRTRSLLCCVVYEMPRSEIKMKFLAARLAIVKSKCALFAIYHDSCLAKFSPPSSKSLVCLSICCKVGSASCAVCITCGCISASDKGKHPLLSSVS